MTQHRVLLFAGLRDLCGRGDLDVELAPGSLVTDLLAEARRQQPPLASASFRVAVDSSYVEEDSIVPEDCEIAFIPPVSGG